AGQEPRRGHPPDLVTGMVHDGDGRTQRIGHREVAERDEADVRPSGRVQGRDDAQGSAYGGAQDGGRRAGTAEQGRHRVSGGLAGRAFAVDELLVGFNLVPGQGVAVAAQAGARGGDGGRVADVGDAPVAVGDEMGYGAERRAVIVDLDQVGPQAGGGPVDEYDRDARVEPGMVVPSRAEQQPGYPALH